MSDYQRIGIGKLGQWPAWWFDRSPANRTSRCDTCYQDVLKDEPRLAIANGRGRHRVGDKGAVSKQYLCIKCAWKIYTLRPPKFGKKREPKIETEPML